MKCVAISSSRGSSRLRDWTWVFCIVSRFLTFWVTKEAPNSFQFNSVQSVSHIQFFGIPWTTACCTSLSITNSQSLLKLMSIELVMPSNHLILCCPLLLLPLIFPSIRVSFPMSLFFAWGGLSTGVSASVSVLPMNTQDWSPLGWTGWISRRLLESSPTPWFKSINSSAFSFLYSPDLTPVRDYWENHSLFLSLFRLKHHFWVSWLCLSGHAGSQPPPPTYPFHAISGHYYFCLVFIPQLSTYHFLPLHDTHKCESNPSEMMLPYVIIQP